MTYRSPSLENETYLNNSCITMCCKDIHTINVNGTALSVSRHSAQSICRNWFGRFIPIFDRCSPFVVVCGRFWSFLVVFGRFWFSLPTSHDRSYNLLKDTKRGYLQNLIVAQIPFVFWINFGDVGKKDQTPLLLIAYLESACIIFTTILYYFNFFRDT